jgi:putative transposase
LALFAAARGTRRVEIAGIVRQPHGAWMKQVARNLTDGVDGFLKGMRYVIQDRDPLFTDEFRRIAERFVLAIKSDCLDDLVPLGERHLRAAVSEFVEHYHLERNHQGLGNDLITRAALPETPAGPKWHLTGRSGLLDTKRAQS